MTVSRMGSVASTRPRRVFVAGHRGMVGSAIVRQLSCDSFCELITADRSDLDLTNQSAVHDFFAAQAIDEVYVAAARCGGIQANAKYPAEFMYDNLAIAINVMHASYIHNVQRLLYLGSSCIYPRQVTQPMREDALLTGSLEPTNEPYAVSKIAGLKLCESYHRQYGCDFRAVMPTNLYGKNDYFHHENAHLVPALMRRFHEAKIAQHPHVTVWGSGTPCRELLYVDDAAAACVFMMGLDPATFRKNTRPQMGHVNVGFGSDHTIREIAESVATAVGYTGELVWDTSKPDGAPKKLIDSGLINALGWKPEISLEDGLQKTYRWFIENVDHNLRV